MVSKDLYVLRDDGRDSTGRRAYFQTMSANECVVTFCRNPKEAAMFTKDDMAKFRRNHPHVKGRVCRAHKEIERFERKV